MNAIALPQAEHADCPTCQGDGNLYQPNFGPTALEPYTSQPCGSCDGTGLVAAEAVVLCPVCGAVNWVGVWCQIPECLDVLADQAAAEALLDIGRIRLEVLNGGAR